MVGIDDRPVHRFQVDVARERGDRGRGARERLRCDQAQVARELDDADVARGARGDAARAEDGRIQTHVDRPLAAIHLDARRLDAGLGAVDAVGGRDRQGTAGQHLAELQHLAVAAVQHRDRHVAGAAHVGRSGDVLQLQRHRTLRVDGRRGAEDDGVVADLQRVGGDRHRARARPTHEGVVRWHDRAERIGVTAELDAVRQDQTADAVDADLGCLRTVDEAHGDRVVRLQGVRVVVLEPGDRHGLDVDRLLAEPTATGRPGIDRSCGVDVVAGVALLLDVGPTLRGRRRQRRFVFPLRRVAEIGSPEHHLRLRADVGVDLQRRHVVDLRDTGDDVHRLVNLLLVKREIDEVVRQLRLAKGARRRQLDPACQALGLEQWRRIAEFDVFPDLVVVSDDGVQVEETRDDLEAVLLELLDLRARLLLALDPDVVLPVVGLVGQRLARLGCLGGGELVADRGDVVVAAGRHQHALEGLDLGRCVGRRVDGAAEAGAVVDRDRADAVGRHVDQVGSQLPLAAVADVDAGVAAGCAQFAVAGADDLPGQRDAPALGRDRVEQDGAVGSIEEARDRHVARAVADAGQRVAQRIGEAGGAPRVEVLVDDERVLDHAALHQAVDVQVLGADVDVAQRQHARPWRLDGGLQRGQARVLRLPGRRLEAAEDEAACLSLGVEHLATEQRLVVDVLPGIARRVVPGIAAEVEVALGRHVHGAGAQLTGDRHAAVQVLQDQASAFVDDLATHIEVLRQGRDGQVVGSAGIAVLDDLDQAARVRGRVLGDLGRVEVDLAGRQRDEFSVHHRGLAAGRHADVVDLQTERRGVEDVDRRAAARGDLAVDDVLQGRLARRTGLDVDRARRRVQVGQVEQKDVQLLRRDQRATFGAQRLGQAHVLQGLLDLLDFGLVARHRLGIAGVAGNPAQQRLAPLDELVADVGVDQPRRLEFTRLDDVELAVEVASEGTAHIAAVDQHFGPGVALVVLRRQVQRCSATDIAVDLAPLLDTGHAGLRSDGARGRAHLDASPEFGVGVVLLLQHQVGLGARGRIEQVVSADFPGPCRRAAIGGLDRHLHHRAAEDIDGDVVGAQCLVHIVLVGVELQRRLLTGGQCRAQALRRELRLAVDCQRQHVHQQLVLDAGFDARGRRHGDQVGTLGNAALRHDHAIGHEGQRQHQAIGGRHAQAFLGDEVHVAQGAHRCIAQQRDGVALGDGRRRRRHPHAGEADQGHVRRCVATQEVGYREGIPSGVEVDVLPAQRRAVQADGVACIDDARGDGSPATEQCRREQRAAGTDTGIGLRRQRDVTAGVDELGAVDQDPAVRAGRQPRLAHRQAQARDSLDADVVGRDDVDQRLHLQHAGLRA